MKNTSDAPQFRDFMLASSLGPSTVVDFGERVRNFQPLNPQPEPFVQAGPEFSLSSSNDRLQRLFKRRRSRRDFGASAMSMKDLGRILQSLGDHDGRRSYASAGGLYPVHVFALLLNVEGEWNNKALRYEPRTHSAGVMGALPSAAEVHAACSLEEGIEPHAILVFVVYPDELERKYGERAGRFAFIEVGHAAQNIALRIADANLAGYEIGGAQDAPVKQMLGLTGTSALIAHGYAIGR